MNCRPPVVSVLVLALVSFMLTATSVFAQAGLSGDPFGGQSAERTGRNSQFDNGTLKSQSALGQLEEMTGSKVDRSSSQYSNRNTTSRAAPQSAPAKPRYDPNQAFRQELAGAVAGALIGALFSDNSAQQRAEAEAAAARAAAEAAAQAEAYRVQQELIRWARIQRAQSYRADWDSREVDITDRLGGAFNIGTGTAFFGRPANPDADVVAAILHQDVGGANPAPDDTPTAANVPDVPESDPSVVDLRGSSLVVQPPRQLMPTATHGRSPAAALPSSQTPRWTDWPDNNDSPPLKRPPSQLQGLLAYFGPWLREWYKDSAKDTAKETLWGLVEHFPGHDRIKGVYDFNEQRKDLTEKMNESYDPLMELALGGATNAATALGSRYNRGGELAESQFDSLEQRGGKVIVDAWSTAFKQFTGHFGSLDLGKLKTVSIDGEMGSLSNVPVHPDTHRLLYGSGRL